VAKEKSFARGKWITGRGSLPYVAHASLRAGSGGILAASFKVKQLPAAAQRISPAALAAGFG
jgi:hypothetical protein